MNDTSWNEPSVSVIPGLIFLAFPQSLLPTILRACVPLVVPLARTGVAFGVYEVGYYLIRL